jgi:hypothetical protein
MGCQLAAHFISLIQNGQLFSGRDHLYSYFRTRQGLDKAIVTVWLKYGYCMAKAWLKHSKGVQKLNKLSESCQGAFIVVHSACSVARKYLFPLKPPGLP